MHINNGVEQGIRPLRYKGEANGMYSEIYNSLEYREFMEQFKWYRLLGWGEWILICFYAFMIPIQTLILINTVRGLLWSY